MLRLTMRRGPTPGASYDLTAPEITIGRGSRNTIVIRDDEVSREHCRLVRAGDDYDLIDLSPNHGTFVNGQRVTGSWPLRPGALIELGDGVTLEYERLNLPSLSRRRTDLETQEAPVDDVSRSTIQVLSGPNAGARYLLEDIIITIGRETTNDIVVVDPEISRYHLRLRRERRGYSVEDMGSTNGTLLNGMPLTQPVVLSNGDILRLGTIVQLAYTRQAPAGGNGLSDEDSGDIITVPVSPPQKIVQIGAASIPGTRALGTGLEPGALLDHILLAYDRYDWQMVGAPLMLSLQDLGLKVWVDQYLVANSSGWRAAIDQAKRECMLMVLIVSPQSMMNPILKQLYRDFRGMGKPVLPLLHESQVPATSTLNMTRPIVFQPRQPAQSARELAEVIARYR
jgi:pSer/pThr/pTyr-binding forkhead associated (FHA) protein